MGSTPTNITTNLRDAMTQFLNQFNLSEPTSVFRDFVLEVDGKKGFAKFSHIMSRATFKKLVDSVEPAGLVSASYEITTDTWKNPISIQRDTLEEANAIAGPDFMQSINNLAIDAVQNRDNEMTILLEGNGNDVLQSAFFANAGVIPNSDQTIDNNHAGTGTTVAQVQDDFFDVIELFANMRNAAGRIYHGITGLGLGIEIMYPPALENVMQEAFMTQLTTGGSGESNILFNKAKLRPNPFLTDANDWFAFLTSPRQKQLVMAVAGVPELQNNVPTGNQNVDAEHIKTDAYLFAARDKFVPGFGSRYNVVRVAQA